MKCSSVVTLTKINLISNTVEIGMRKMDLKKKSNILEIPYKNSISVPNHTLVPFLIQFLLNQGHKVQAKIFYFRYFV